MSSKSNSLHSSLTVIHVTVEGAMDCGWMRVSIMERLLSADSYSCDCRGCYGLWLDESLYHGTTRHCATYDNKLLTTSEDFTIAFLEVWGFN